MFPELMGGVDMMGTNTADHHRMADTVVAHPRAVARVFSNGRLDDLAPLGSVVSDKIELAVGYVNNRDTVVPIIDDPESSRPNSTPDMPMLPVKDEPQRMGVAPAENYQSIHGLTAIPHRTSPV